MRITHTKDSQALTVFAEKYKGRWHGYKNDKRTLKAVERAKLLGRIETNEFEQFKYKKG